MTDTTPPLRVIEQTTRIAAPPETVWSFWTDPELIVEWFGSAAEIVPQPGGLFRTSVAGAGVMRGTFVELDPPRRLVFTFGWENNAPGEALAPGSTVVEVTLTPDDGDTILHLRHSEMPTSHAAEHLKGWAACIGDGLVAAVSAHLPLPTQQVGPPRHAAPECFEQ